MKKSGFKFISIFIVIAMLLSAAACGDESETKVVKKKKVIDRYHEAESSSDESTSSDDSASGSGDSVGVDDNYQHNTGTENLEGNTYLSGFPIVKDKEKITIMAVTRSDVGDITNSDFTKTYSKLTNMDIEWQLVTEGAARQRVTLALQSGNLPDLIALGSSYVTNDDILRYGPEGTMVEITKSMLEKWAPNVKATYDKYPEAWDYTNVDGKMYTIASFFADFPYGQHFLWVRTTWLDKLGLDIGSIIHITGLRPVSVTGFEGTKNERNLRTGAKGGQFAVEMVTLENGGIIKSIHGGSDYYSMYNFIEKISGNSRADTIDVYEAMDMCLPGMFAYRSILNGGMPVDIPDLRNKSVRDKWRNDTACTDPKAAGDMLLPVFSKGTPEIDDGVYDYIKELWENEIAGGKGYRADAFDQGSGKKN